MTGQVRITPGRFPVQPLVVAARPAQWFKNLFVLAPVVFARRFFDPASVESALLAFGLLCLASSAVYLFNDVLDAEADRRHPEKRHRPVAAGLLAPGLALGAAAFLAVFAMVCGFLATPLLGLCVAGFLLVNLFYTTVGKKTAYLDLLCIAINFILRVVAGAVAIPVVISAWILLCTFFIAIYLGLGKRLHELGTVSPDSRRSALGLYSPKLTWILLYVFALATLAAFVAYTLSSRTVASFGGIQLVWSSPLVALGILRYAQIVRRLDRRRSPTDSIIFDPAFLFIMLAWAVAVFFLVYQQGG